MPLDPWNWNYPISALGLDSQIMAAALELSMQDSGMNNVVRPEGSLEGVVDA
jgi:hypothetical protein